MKYLRRLSLYPKRTKANLKNLNKLVTISNDCKNLRWFIIKGIFND